MKSICIDARMLEKGGIGTYLKSLIQSLKNKDLKIHLIISKSFIYKYKWLQGYNLIFLEASIYSIKEQLLLPFKIPKCDLFWSPNFNVPLLPIQAKKRLVTIHDVYHLAHLSTFRFLEKIYAKYVINKAAKLSNTIITVSDFSKSEIIKYTKISNQKIQVIYNGIDFARFQENDLNDEIEKKYKLPKKYFLFVGNLKSHKNLNNLIASYKKIDPAEDIHLIIIGKSKGLINTINLDELANNRIHIFSEVEDNEISYFYKRSKAFVFPSFYEGFGYPLIEAMQMKCPVIASHIPAVKEICGAAVHYIDPYDVDSIYEAMKLFLKDEKLVQFYINKAKERVRSFSLDNMIKQHIQLINKMI